MLRAGEDIGRDQVARLMRGMGLRGVRRGRQVFTTRADDTATRPTRSGETQLHRRPPERPVGDGPDDVPTWSGWSTCASSSTTSNWPRSAGCIGSIRHGFAARSATSRQQSSRPPTTLNSPQRVERKPTTESSTDPGLFRPRTFAVTDPGVPLCLSSGDFAGFELTRCASFVGDHESPEVGGESSLQAAECPVSGLAFGEFRVEVVPTLSRIRTWVTATRWVRPRSPRCRTHSCPRSPAARILVVPPSAIRRDAVCSSLSHRGLIGSSGHRPTLHR